MKWHIRHYMMKDEGRRTKDEGADRKLQAVRRSSFGIRLILLVCLLLPAAAAAQPREEALVIPAGQTYAGNLATVTRDIRVEGVVAGDVTSWSGDIEVLGRVEGDVVSYSGQVTLRTGAQVGGHVLASGGLLQQDNGVKVAGQAIRGEGGGIALANLLDLFSPAAEGRGTAAVGRALFGVALGVFLLAFTLLCIAFWPQRTAVASLTLRRAPGRALALGLLTTLLLALALPPLAALLAATLIGLPLIVLLLALAQVPYIYGLATLARVIGALLPASPTPAPTRPALPDPLSLASDALGAQGPGGVGRTALAVAGLALLIALGAVLAPLWGLALFYVLASPGLGAALLSRGGLLAPAYE